MSAVVMDGQEPPELSKQLLKDRDRSPGTFWAVTSPNCHRDHPFDVLLVFECPRRLWHAGPAKIGRPIADPRCCGQVRLLLMLADAASKQMCTSIFEVLRDKNFDNVHPADPVSVRGYRLWIMASRVQIANMSSHIAQMWSNVEERPFKRRRTSEGFRNLQPGIYDVSPFIATETSYRDLVMAYAMGTFNGFSSGVTFEIDNHAPQAADHHGAEVSNDGFAVADYFDDNANAAFATNPSQASTPSASTNAQTQCGILPDSHVLAPFEAVRYFEGNTYRTDLIENRYTAMNLYEEQRNLSNYIHMGQFTLPRPKDAKDILWGSNAFQGGASLIPMLLPDMFPDVELLAQTISDSIAFQGGDMRQKLRASSMAELLDVFSSGELADPTQYAAIQAPSHWGKPVADASSMGSTAIAKIYPAIALAQRHVSEHIRLVRSDVDYTVETAILERMQILFDSPPDGAPDIFHNVRMNMIELKASMQAKSDEGKLIRRLLFSKRMARKFLPTQSMGRMDFTSIAMMQIAKMTAYGLKLTPLQQCAYNHIIWCLGRLYILWAVPAFLAIFQGHVQLGKTHLMDQLCASLCNAAVLMQGTRSRLSDLKNVTGQVSFQDDSISNEEEEGGLRSSASTGIRSHSINVATPSGGRVVEDQVFLRNLALIISTNFHVGEGIATRAVEYIFPDNADDSSAVGKLDFVLGCGNSEFECATSKVMKIINGWTRDFATQHAVHGLALNTTMYHVVVSLMRTIMKDFFTLAERDCRAVFYNSIGYMIIRITQLWNRVLAPKLDGQDDVFIEKKRIRFLRTRCILTGQDVFRSAVHMLWVADKSQYKQEIASCIRDCIVMVSTNSANVKVPADAEDSAYYLTSLSSRMEEALGTIRGMSTMLKGGGKIPSFLKELMSKNSGGSPLIKQDTKAKRLVVLKSWAEGIVTKTEQVVLRALATYWDMSRNAQHSDDRIAAVEYDEPDDPWVVFRAGARGSLYDPLKQQTFNVPEELRKLATENKDRLLDTLGFMPLRDDFKINNTGTINDPLSMVVAGVVRKDNLPGYDPTTYEEPSADGYIRSHYPDPDNLLKTRKTWSHSLAVKESTLKCYTSADTTGSSGMRALLQESFEAVIAVEGLAKVGDSIVIGVPPGGRTDPAEPCEVFTVKGVPDNWHVTVPNKIHRMEPPRAKPGEEDEYTDDESSDEDDELGMSDEGQFNSFSLHCDATNNIAFPPGQEYRRFTADSLYPKIESLHSKIHTGHDIEDQFKFETTDFLW